ncbi:YbgC/FadM family acyl-CoA thioesterase [Pleomorphomonas oryzae]|uniref:YbgC/FadM family acyl-CoA thioesterase n=1 Tax=Pleomorphomonas oryzae TaxID=261934 RepID=UPI000400F8C7|nr:YbgC/FadM family acyl-CoA thioesterase [Pleomorphomonas oryzae]
MTVHRLAVRVYFEDTDAGGILYHGSHMRFFERGRTEFLRDLGISQSLTADRTDPNALLFVVRRFAIEYKRASFLDDLLTVETEIGAISGPRFTVAQRLLRGDDLIAEAEVEVVATGGNGRPRRLPPAMAALIESAR